MKDNGTCGEFAVIRNENRILLGGLPLIGQSRVSVAVGARLLDVRLLTYPVQIFAEPIKQE